MTIDQCSFCEPRDRVVLELRPDGALACPHRMNWRKNGLVGTVTLGAAVIPTRYGPISRNGLVDSETDNAKSRRNEIRKLQRESERLREDRRIAEERCARMGGVAAAHIATIRDRDMTIAAIRADLASANADFANLHGQHIEALAELEKMRGHDSQACHPDASCDNDILVATLKNIQARARAIIDVAKNGGAS